MGAGLPYVAVILVLLSVVLLRSVKKDGLSAPAIRLRKWSAVALGIAAVALAVLAALDDMGDHRQDDVTTLTGDRIG